MSFPGRGDRTQAWRQLHPGKCWQRVVAQSPGPYRHESFEEEGPVLEGPRILLWSQTSRLHADAEETIDGGLWDGICVFLSLLQ